MTICAVILDYRGAQKTEACLLSLIAQGVDTVLVVDNSEDQEASQQLADAAARVRQKDVDYSLHIVTSGVNLGFAGGVNFALGHAKARHCDTFLLLNNDATIYPGSVELLNRTLEKHIADLVSPAIVDDDGTPQRMMWYQRFFGLMTYKRLPGSYPYLCGCCLMFRRDLLVSEKLFDEDFFMYGEDTLLSWRLLREHKKFACIDTATVRHTGQGKFAPSTLFYEYHMTRAHILLALKARNNPLEIPVLVAAKCIGLIARAMRRSIRYRRSTPLLAFVLAWRRFDIRKI
jgi:N-acetylglucosaminyl-diphospho-decaprenol L-rhamnosyltransferase